MKHDQDQRWKFYYKTPEENQNIHKELLVARKETEYHGTSQHSHQAKKNLTEYFEK